MAAYGTDHTGVRCVFGLMLLRGTGFFAPEPSSRAPWWLRHENCAIMSESITGLRREYIICVGVCDIALEKRSVVGWLFSTGLEILLRR